MGDRDRGSVPPRLTHHLPLARDTPMDCQALGAPRLMGQEKPDLSSSGTMALNQRWPRRGTHHHLP